MKKIPYYLLIFLLLLSAQCRKEHQVPGILISDVVDITSGSATCTISLSDPGDAKVKSLGVCWSKDHIPTIADDQICCADEDESCQIQINGLLSNKTYYVRAFASNRYGTGYSETVQVKTLYHGEIVTDIDGNQYHTVTIGTQTWMLENLRVTRFRNGDTIPLVSDSLDWADWHPRRCYYNNDPQNLNEYGFLYNQWTAIDSNGLAPVGWHIPTNDEYQTLINYLGGEYLAGGRLKEMGFGHWNEPNTDGGNESGFTALPGGYRREYGWFEGQGNTAAFWTNSFWRYIRLFHNNGQAWLISDSPAIGASVRCIKD